MSFEGYSPAALDFLWGIRFNNERGWFLAHKEDYQSHVLAPTRALGEQVYDAMHEKYPHEPFLLKMSRIYRDARRLHGQGPYKDHLWFCIRAGRSNNVQISRQRASAPAARTGQAAPPFILR